MPNPVNLAPLKVSQFYTPPTTQQLVIRPGNLFTQSLTAGLSFVGNFAKGLRYLRNFSATLLAPPTGSPVIDANYTFYNTNDALLTGSQIGVGESFVSSGGKLAYSTFNAYLQFSPSGNIYSKLWSFSAGNVGTLLATSDPIDTAGLTWNTPLLLQFNFTGANQYNLAAGMTYFIALEYKGAQQVLFFVDTTSSYSSGSGFETHDDVSWAGYFDIPFEVHVTTSTSLALLTRKPLKSLAATFSPVAALLKKITDAGFTATLSFIGAITKSVSKNFTATLSWIGNIAESFIAGGGHVFTQGLTATLSFIGAVKGQANKLFTPTLSPTAAVTRRTSHLLSATLSFIGAIAKRGTRFLAATQSFTGLLTASKSFLKSLTATLSFVGNLSVSKSFLRAFTATLSFVGTFGKRAGKAFTAALNFVGALQKTIPKFVTANLLTSGAITKRITDAGFAATTSFTGFLAASKSFLKSFTANLSFVGAMSFIKSFGRAFTATLNATATLSRSIRKPFNATLSAAASLVRRITHTLGGTLSFVGATAKVVRDAGFTATLSFVGALATATHHFFVQSYTATLSFVGSLARVRQVIRTFTATLAFSGSIQRRTGKALAATLAFSVAIGRVIRKKFAAVLSFIGFLFRGGAVTVLAGWITKCLASIGIASSTAKIAQAGSQLEVVKVVTGADIPVTGSNLRVERTE
jgi:hypothetical protein